MFSFNYFYLFQQQQIFIKDKKGEYQVFQGLVQEEVFHLHKLATNIVCQSSDPEFADKLSRVCEAKQTSADIKKMKALKDTDATTWPEKFANLYLNFQKNDTGVDKLFFFFSFYHNKIHPTTNYNAIKNKINETR